MNNLEEKLNETITIFLRGLGFKNIKVFKSDEFAYILRDGKHSISYTLHDTAYNDLGFMKYVHKNYKVPECSIFTLSLLHELGHYITFPYLNKKKMAKAQKAKKAINKMKVNSMKKAIAIQMKYSALYDERVATAVAVKLLKRNYKFILEFEYYFNEILKTAGAV